MAKRSRTKAVEPDDGHGIDRARVRPPVRVIDLIDTDKSAKELPAHRAARVNATGRYENWTRCVFGCES